MRIVILQGEGGEGGEGGAWVPRAIFRGSHERVRGREINKRDHEIKLNDYTFLKFFPYKQASTYY